QRRFPPTSAPPPASSPSGRRPPPPPHGPLHDPPFLRFSLRPAIMRHDPGLAASPVLRCTLVVERSVLLSACPALLRARQRPARRTAHDRPLFVHGLSAHQRPHRAAADPLSHVCAEGIAVEQVLPSNHVL